jgi:hypothetical protein
VIQQQGDLEFLEQVFERAAAAKNSGNRTNPYTGHGTVPNPDTGHGTVPDPCVTALRELRLRYFTPLEIAKILGFPVEAHPDGEAKFEFPPDIPANSRLAYRVLGNSLSVTTVSFLTVLLFMKA